MTVAVLDASALLAFLLSEPGSDVVSEALEAGAACSTVNLSEVLQKLGAAGVDWRIAAGILDGFGLILESPVRDDAIKAAELWQKSPYLSLADRFCLATAQRLGVPALTADRAWGDGEGITQIR